MVLGQGGKAEENGALGGAEQGEVGEGFLLAFSWWGFLSFYGLDLLLKMVVGYFLPPAYQLRA